MQSQDCGWSHAVPKVFYLLKKTLQARNLSALLCQHIVEDVYFEMCHNRCKAGVFLNCLIVELIS